MGFDQTRPEASFRVIQAILQRGIVIFNPQIADAPFAVRRLTK
jgi:hypothetical protein